MSKDEQSVAGLVESYIRAFNAADFPACLACYQLPLSFITSRGAAVLSEADAFLSMWRANHADLQAKGWSHSVLAETHVRVLDEGLALASVAVARHVTDGRETETLAGLYTLRKGRGGWKIISVVSHRLEGLLRFTA